jgi:Ca-activated chloride channel family protein
VKRGQVLVLAVAAVAVAIVALVAGGGGGGGDGGDGGDGSAKAPAGAIRVSFAYSPEKEKLLVPLIERFNRERAAVRGRAVFVEGQKVSSGEAESKIAGGRLEPVVWSPASSLWGRLLNFEADTPYVGDESPSIVRTPLVIAMWEPMARALGWPKRAIGFADVLELASSGAGWGRYGRPEFGAFKLVHTNPDFSTSGLSAVVAEYYAATGKKEGLTVRDVETSRARRTVRSIERSIVHYGDTTLFIAEQMKKGGPGYASAVAMEEVTLLDFNRTRGSQPRLVAIYPAEGTFYSDNPFIVLDAPWVSSAQREGAARFREFLADRITPQLAARSGFRPADLKAKPVPPVTKQNGADPAQPERVLGLPEPRVLDRVRRAWREDRKPANVLLVVDTSGSMNDEGRLERAREGLATFLREVSPNDRVGLTTFSESVRPLVPIAPVRENRRRLATTIDGLVADGGTAVYDATIEGAEAVAGLRDRERINAVVVLTDGEDTDSSRSSEEVVRRLEAQGDSATRVRVFTIAYSAGAAGAAEALGEIAAASGGQAYTGDTDEIELVYRSISSFF